MSDLVRPLTSASTNELLAIGVIFWTISTVSFGLRAWTRGLIVREFGIDDWLMFVTLLFFSVFCGLIMALTVMGSFGHDFIKERPLNLTLNILLATELFYVLATMVLKLSLGFFFLRIVPYVWQRYTIYGTLIISTMLSVSYFFVTIFQCGPPSQYWVNKIVQKCHLESSFLGISYTHATVIAVSDLIMTSIPIPIVVQSKLKEREKHIVIGIILLAAVGSIASFIRIKYISVLNSQSLTIWNEIVALGVWSIIEIGLGITAGSICTLRPLIRNLKWKISWFGSCSETDKSSSRDNSRTAAERTFTKGKISQASNYSELDTMIDRTQDAKEQDENDLEKGQGEFPVPSVSSPRVQTRSGLPLPLPQLPLAQNSPFQRSSAWFPNSDVWVPQTFLQTEEEDFPEQPTPVAQEAIRSPSKGRRSNRSSLREKLRVSRPPSTDFRQADANNQFTQSVEAQDSYIGWAKYYTGPRDRTPFKRSYVKYDR